MSKVKALAKKKHKKAHKPVVLKKHHAKPYRKRHYGALVILSSLAVVLATNAVIYQNELSDATKSARNYISDMFKSSNTDATVSSSYGFSVTYDTSKYYSGAVDSATGELYFSNELSTKRPYELIRFSSSKTGSSSDLSSMTMQYYPNVSVLNADDPSLVKLELGIAQGSSNEKTVTLTKIRDEKVTISGVGFVKTDWSVNPKSLGKDVLKSYLSTYRGSVNGKAFVIKIAKGITENDIYSEIVSKITFGEKTVVNNEINKDSIAKKENSNKLLNSLLFTATAKAAMNQDNSTEIISAKYSASVVQIWNFYCMDIDFNGKPFLLNACDGSGGSGFFIGSDGHIATNGHVVNQDPKGIAISFALNKAFVSADYLYLDVMLAEAGVTEASLMQFDTDLERADFAIDKLYSISDSKITTKNNVSNLMVMLNDKKPEVKEMIDLTNKRKEYTEQDSIKRAKLEVVDYRLLDGFVKWRASDVALIKIEGSNYPVVKTGSAASVVQGSALTILGYPSQATNNNIVEDEVSKVSVTSGKVSAIKNAKGSEKKLIETDSTIGHGNSGGPAFDSSGLVVGLATYTSDGSGIGNGVFNYIRDIKDLQDIIQKNSITLKTTSTTQSKWEEGLSLFYGARYSKAVKKFEEVKTLFPQHAKADDFIATSNERIKNGQDVKDFPYLLVGAGAFVALAGAGAMVLVIRRQKHKHNLYLEHVANSGGATPFDQGVNKITLPSPAQAQQNNPFNDSSVPRSSMNNNPQVMPPQPPTSASIATPGVQQANSIPVATTPPSTVILPQQGVATSETPKQQG